MENYNQTYLLDLPVEEAQKLYLRAAIVEDNPFQNKMGLFTWTFGQTKVKMLQMRINSYNLQPKTGCDTWNPTVRAGLSPDTIRVTDYELNGEQCPDEFDAGCARLMRGPLGQGAPGDAFGPFEEAMVTMLRRSLSGDLHKVVWFSDMDVRAQAAAEGLTPLPRDPKSRERMFTMLEQQDGIWAEIEGRTRTTNADARINYVDSNDGTQAGNATRAENITTFLDRIIAAAPSQLLNWNYQNEQGSFDKPVFLLQSGLFNAYKTYLRSLGTEMANRFILDGEVMRDTLEYDGYLVKLIPEWRQHDAEMGRIAANGKSTKQRAIFTVLGNLTGVANMNNLQSQPGSGLIIQRSPLLKDKGKTWMYADYGIGVGIAQSDLMVASFNSSTTFA